MIAEQIERLGSIMLCSGRNAPRNRPSCCSCCPLSRTKPSAQIFMAEVGSVEETTRAVMISRRAGARAYMIGKLSVRRIRAIALGAFG